MFFYEGLSGNIVYINSKNLFFGVDNCDIVFRKLLSRE